MQTLSAHSIATPVHDLLVRAGETHGLVAGSWPTAAYVDIGGFVVALVGRAVPFMPNAISITALRGLDALRRGARVRLSPTEVRSEGFVVRVAGAARREASVPHNEGRGAAEVGRRAEELWAALDLDAHDGLAERARILSLTIDDDVAEALIMLERALRHLDPRAAAGAARLLVGRGPGLTPEGDDLLAGCTAALLAFRAPLGLPEEMVDTIARALAGGRDGLTTPLSATLLRLAIDGRVVEPAARVLDLALPLQEWKSALARLAGIGHSTGRAYAFGCCLAAAAAATTSSAH